MPLTRLAPLASRYLGLGHLYLLLPTTSPRYCIDLRERACGQVAVVGGGRVGGLEVELFSTLAPTSLLPPLISGLYRYTLHRLGGLLTVGRQTGHRPTWDEYRTENLTVTEDMAVTLECYLVIS